MVVNPRHAALYICLGMTTILSIHGRQVGCVADMIGIQCLLWILKAIDDTVMSRKSSCHADRKG